jgi:CRISPR/Cas system CSM-associated protein Csm4 (group 5 of RAMP superfamily)
MKQPSAQWEAPVRSALLLLADSGFGGERSRGWGRSEAPEWRPWTPPQAPGIGTTIERAHWLLSLYTPAKTTRWIGSAAATPPSRGAAASKAARAGASPNSRPR